ncbi:MAG: NADH-quinone oxidoreductase subunit L [Candidatus Brocadia sp.]|nr:NADH-quinone oxidoreductase subunit L [Candidatus Brocadia fulgida]MCC6324949.1 NADH-quinone oxidoreductase subunit L [Candidatus Brocadia sp.]MDG5997394.1 NADH-quinone oxidoreductase subunit L [Candidatus Brocadia sp.]RIK02026.1 MAG: NADH-quinone oxidoreductase subunit L [Candidatus Brocadia sp.]UJS19586.1 MAG: NADH-quinone oxidoreductase subunit L [Candidatus Brocadia sp.]
MLNLVSLILLFPLIGSAINGLAGKRLRKETVGYLACGAIGLSFLVSILVFCGLLLLPPEGRLFEKHLFRWIESGSFISTAALQVDPLSSLMILVVTSVGFLIHIYSIGYMHHDKGYHRYFCYLNLFAFSMLLLVLSNNFLLMFIGWEAVGLCSYLLIGFWFEKESASNAAKKAFVVNRVGDFGFALGVMLIFLTFHSVDFTEVFSAASHGNFEVGSFTVTIITLLLFMGATGKSAQIPLYTWLPDAMEGPTPVSALIHAATMVTAGVYMIARCNALYLLSPFTMTVVACIGGATALFAASVGLVQNDIKRVLAYSTISQLGYMFLACGVGAFTAGVFHLMTHAFFKALLFLGSGSVIHALSGEQDIRKMGGLKSHIPVTYKTFLIGTVAIAGIPPFAGFFSKDEILLEAFVRGNFIYWSLGAIAALLTAFYMFRLLFMTFHGESRVSHHAMEHLHESPKNMTLPLTVLAGLSFFGGFLGIPGANALSCFLAPVLGGHGHAETAGHHGAWLPYLMMAVSTAIAIAGIFLAYQMYIKKPGVPQRLAERFRFVHTLLLNKYYVDEIYDALFVNPVKKISAQFLWKGVDVRIIDGSVNGIARLVGGIGNILRLLQTGYIRNYAFYIVAGCIFIIVLAVFGR